MAKHAYSFLVGGPKLQTTFFSSNGSVGNANSIASALVRAPGESGVDFTALYGSQGSQQIGLARGAVSFVGATGTIGAVVGGVPLTFAASGNNATDAENMCFAVFGSSSPLINPGGAGGSDIGTICTNVFAEVSCGAVVAGDKIYLAGQDFVAIPEGQTPQLSGQWTASTTDVNLHAANLARAINDAGLAYVAFLDPAVNGSVFIFQNNPLVVLPASVIFSNTVHLVVTPFATSNRAMIFPITPGVPGNHVTFAASGTGVTAFGTVNGRMSGGTGLTGFPLVQR